MMRMLKMEFTVFGQYLRQLSLTMVIMAVCITIGSGSAVSLPGIIFMMTMFSFTMSASHYDEQNNWAAFRLTMPLSRRDVVLGRYLFVFLGSCACAALAALGALALAGLASVDVLPAGVADMVRLDAEGALIGGFTLAVCGAMGMLTASVSMPVFFKFGHTKATQWLPFIMIFLGMILFLTVGLMEGEAISTLQRALSFAETPEGLAEGLPLFTMGASAFGVACYVASALVSLRVYRSREL